VSFKLDNEKPEEKYQTGKYNMSEQEIQEVKNKYGWVTSDHKN